MEEEDLGVGEEQPPADHEEPVAEPEAAQEPAEEAQREAEASEYDAPLAEAISEQVTEHVAEAEQPEPSELKETVFEPAPEQEPIKPEALVTKEDRPPATTSLSMRITPPQSHPAGPPPVAEETEKLSIEHRDNIEDMDEEDVKENNSEPKEKGKKKKKKKKKNRPEMWAKQVQEAERRRQEEEARDNEDTNDVEVEYIQEELELDPLDPMYRTFSKIFATFKIVDPKEAQAMKEEEVNMQFSFGQFFHQ